VQHRQLINAFSIILSIQFVDAYSIIVVGVGGGEVVIDWVASNCSLIGQGIDL
jgi:hypothetical protein